ncbi:glycosyltransferase family 39 protein [Hymenobacter sp. 15J16-1T3B]|uniref:ArnT family glycosyltransferase n=1 Tax=Hymenobacter sp. 15J16-1T3B TaxID=2886941 RepID=UPI001D12D247|nr:glycosyltransferase family 39 protein [Hymenobacter sp. 15J16-1T3B]MCC3155942.1 glycosyltransferase family 39 protein [Hymenobacter sp. 15J16-1T3B]
MNVSFLATRTVPRWFWPVLLGLSFLVHLPFFGLPPKGAHSWRQCNTMAVARNLYEEDMNPLRPRVDRRGASDGVTGMQFPAYEWVVAAAYKVLGFHESIPRVVSWLIFAAGLVAFFALARLLSGSAWAAAVGTWALAWSPELFYHGINALPDVLALAASIGGLYFFLRWYHTGGGFGSYALALLLTTLAGLTKLQYLAIGAPIAVLILRDLGLRRLTLARLPLLGLFAAVAVAVPLAWYARAVRLIKESGLADFGLELRPADSISTALRILRENLTSDLPELLVGFPGFVLLLLGLAALVRGGYARRFWFLPLLGWAAVLLAYHLIELSQMDVHQYYMLPYLPVLMLVVALGAAWLQRQKRGALWLALLLGLQPVAAAVRVIPSRWGGGPREIPAELYYADSRQALETAVPNDALCLVGPDISGCKYFYFLHKKGFGFGATEDLWNAKPDGSTLLDSAVRAGTRYLYTNDSTALHNEKVRAYLGREIKRVGEFRVLELKQRAASETDASETVPALTQNRNRPAAMPGL